MSDFSLIDAIESGIVKIPRVPVADNAMTGEFPKYRNLWVHIRDGLPKKGRGTDDLLHLVVEVTGEKKLEKEAKVTTAATLWVPAVNNERAFGRWAFLEIDAGNRHKAMDVIRKFLVKNS